MTKSLNVIIIGAGKAGSLLLMELNQPRYKNYNVVGFIDDDEKKLGSKVDNLVKLMKATGKPVRIHFIGVISASGC